LLLFGLRHTTATDASLLLNLETTATTILAYWFFKENISIKSGIANMGIFSAGIILAFQGTFTPGIGGILIALGCISWGIDNNNTASIHNIDPVRCTFLKGITFGVINLIIALFLIDHLPAWKFICAALIIGAFSYGISIVLYISSARGIGAARSRMVFTSAPFFGVALSQLYLGESMDPYQIVSACLIAGMLIILLKEKHGHHHAHKEIEHEHKHTHDDKHHEHYHETIDKIKVHDHKHLHGPVVHDHPHWPDLHHRHGHE
jgi:drug/metabolite transporter (DMT)-like permease